MWHCTVFYEMSWWLISGRAQNQNIYYFCLHVGGLITDIYGKLMQKRSLAQKYNVLFTKFTIKSLKLSKDRKLPKCMGRISITGVAVTTGVVVAKENKNTMFESAWFSQKINKGITCTIRLLLVARTQFINAHCVCLALLVFLLDAVNKDSLPFQVKD